MARAAVPGRLTWRAVTIAATRQETASARTLTLGVPGWPGHLPGQHVAVRLTAADGYSAQRDYSIASAPDGDRVELTVQRTDDGEVSPYLADIAEPGDQFDLRGPIGGWFTWDPCDTRPLLLLAGGSGIVPLMAMLRTHDKVRSQAPVRLVYSARTPADVIYATELSERSRVSPLTLTYTFTRTRRSPGAWSPAASTPAASAPAAGAWSPAASTPAAGAANHRVHHGRLNSAVLAEAAFPPEFSPAIYVCGPSGFVEAAADLLVAAGHAPGAIKTERFGS